MTIEEKFNVMCKAFDMVLTGGNHLANNLINELGASNKQFPPYGTPHEQVRKILAKRYPKNWIGKYEQWCAWNSCMLARGIVEEVLGERGWDNNL